MTMRHSNVILSALVVACFQAATGQNHSFMQLYRDIKSPIGVLQRSYFESNPAAMVYRDSVSISTAQVAADYTRRSRAVMVQEGKGHTLFSIGAQSYYRLSPTSTVWGNAGYTTGEMKGIYFTDAVDYRLIAPYTLGDNTGGDIKSQQYLFGGGWSRQYGAWSVGIEGNYRAQIMHRSVDPRLRDIVSDLEITAGATRSINSHYRLGLNLGIRIYHQNVDVDFYNPNNTIKTNIYTGLGSSFARFKNNDVLNNGYNLTGCSASLQLLPAAGNRFAGMVSARKLDNSMILRDRNNLTLGTTGTWIIDVSAARRFTAGTVTLFPNFRGRLFARKGSESLLGSSAGNNYEKVGQRSIYRHRIMQASLSLPVMLHLNASGSLLTVTPAATVDRDKEQLLSPERCISVSAITPSVNVNTSINLADDAMLAVDIDAAYRFTSSTSPVLGELENDNDARQAVIDNYEMLSARLLSASARISFSKIIARKVWSVSIAYRHESFRHIAHGNMATATIAATF